MTSVRLLNGEPTLKCIDVVDLMKVFEVKSTLDEGKVLYLYILESIFNDLSEIPLLFSDNAMLLFRTVLRESVEVVFTKMSDFQNSYEFVKQQAKVW